MWGSIWLQELGYDFFLLPPNKGSDDEDEGQKVPPPPETPMPPPLPPTPDQVIVRKDYDPKGKSGWWRKTLFFPE